jgi:hypothetical protein
MMQTAMLVKGPVIQGQASMMQPPMLNKSSGIQPGIQNQVPSTVN